MEKLNDFYLNIDIELENNKLFIAQECSSGCKYKIKNKEELLQYINDYIADAINYELEN